MAAQGRPQPWRGLAKTRRDRGSQPRGAVFSPAARVDFPFLPVPMPKAQQGSHGPKAVIPHQISRTSAFPRPKGKGGRLSTNPAQG